MVVFITSVRHPLNSNSYLRVESLLYKTLLSVCNQSSDNYKVIVVCNQKPDIPFISNKVIFLETALPAPSQLSKATTGRKTSRLDKGCKYYLGVKHAQRFNPSYVMFFDADDFIHKGITEFLEGQNPENGWYVEQGLVLNATFPVVKEVAAFHQVCGTSFIFSNTIFSPYLKEIKYTDHLHLLEQVDEYFITNILGAHIETKAFLDQQGLSFRPLPFPAAVWVVDTGENHSGQSFINLPGQTKVLNANMVADFNIQISGKEKFRVIKKYVFLVWSFIFRGLRMFRRAISPPR